MMISNFKSSPLPDLLGLNNRGDIVGVIPGSEFGFIYARGVLAQVLFPGSTETTVLGINNKGDIVGTYQMAGESVAFTALSTRRGFLARWMPPLPTSRTPSLSVLTIKATSLENTSLAKPSGVLSQGRIAVEDASCRRVKPMARSPRLQRPD